MSDSITRGDCSPPWNFSWVVQDKLAAMAWPQSSANMCYLSTQGIRHLVTLSPEKRPPLSDKLFETIKWHEIAIEEFTAPSLQQIQEFIDICEAAMSQCEAVGVHCRMGRGRTGVMAACFLVRFFDQPPQTAISNLRLMRPGSVETYEQERAVRSYHDFIRTSAA